MPMVLVVDDNLDICRAMGRLVRRAGFDAEWVTDGYEAVDRLRKRENLVNVFVLIDSRHSPQKIDLDFINQLGKWEVPFMLVFTKADKETQREVSKNVKSFLDAMRKTWQFLPQHFVTSAVKKMGREKILKTIEELNDQFSV